MNAEQRRRARLAVAAPSAFGLGAGLWTLTPLTQPDPRWPDDPSGYAMGMLLMAVTLVGAWVLNAIGLFLRAWIMGEPVGGPLDPCWRRP